MTGHEHFLEAERLVERADALLKVAAEQHGEESAVAGFHMAMARAQVHATLAVAAVTAGDFAWARAMGPTAAPPAEGEVR